MVLTVSRGVNLETEDGMTRSLAAVFALRGGMGTNANTVSNCTVS